MVAAQTTLLAALRAVLAEAGPLIEARGITLLGISIANLDDDGSVQLELPFDRSGLTSLDLALDDVKERFGSSAVTRAVHLGKDPGWSVPMLPD